MISNDISEIILKRLDKDSRVIDIGGARYPWFRANYILDKRTYDQKIGPVAYAGRNEKECFSRDTWISHDFYDLPWPFEDKFFDFSLCMGTLEDVRDPIVLCKEIQRVSKAGYISTPTRAAESQIGVSTHPASNQLYGYFHHRWNVEICDSKLVFTQKSPLLYQHREYLINDYGQHTLNYFWDSNFAVEESHIGSHDDALASISRFAYTHREWLSNVKAGNIDQKRYNYWPSSWGVSPNFFEIDQKDRPLKKQSTRLTIKEIIKKAIDRNWNHE